MASTKRMTQTEIVSQLAEKQESKKPKQKHFLIL